MNTLKNSKVDRLYTSLLIACISITSWTLLYALKFKIVPGDSSYVGKFHIYDLQNFLRMITCIGMCLSFSMISKFMHESRVNSIINNKIENTCKELEQVLKYKSDAQIRIAVNDIAKSLKNQSKKLKKGKNISDEAP